MNRIRTAGLIVALALAGAACSSSDGGDADNSAASTESAPTSSVDTTDAPEVTTGSSAATTTATTEEPTVDTTAAPPTTTEPAPTTPATDPPSTTATTAPDPETPEDEIVQAVEFFEQQWKTCLSELPNCDTLAVADRRGREDVGTIQSQAIRWNQNDYRVENIDAYSYEVRSVTVAGDEATAEVCVTDPLVLTEADGTVVDDGYFSYFLDWTLTRRDDGQWWVESRIQNGEEFVGEENDVCAE